MRSISSIKPVVVVMVVLFGNRPVPNDLFNAVRFQLTRRYLYLHFDFDQTYTAEELCGEAFYAWLGQYDPQKVGLCISHLSNQGDVDLIRVTPPGVYPVRYRLKPLVGHRVAVPIH
jgi:hypothetical protein